MNKILLVTLVAGLSSQGFAFEDSNSNNANQPVVKNESKGISSSSDSLFADVECDMTDYTCYKLVLELGQQEAIAQIANPEQEVSELLLQSIEVYKRINPEAVQLSDDEIILLLATN